MNIGFREIKLLVKVGILARRKRFLKTWRKLLRDAKCDNIPHVFAARKTNVVNSAPRADRKVVNRKMNVTANESARQNLTIEQKETNLRRLMRRLESVLVAFSGGVDSSYLALIATEELGDKALCVTGVSASLSAREREFCLELAAKFNFNHETIATAELNDPNYQANAPNRCYFCKSELYGKLAPLARERNLNFVVDGSNTDDLTDFRPGRQAAAENRVRSPLVEANLSKNEIRALSQQRGLPTWDKPASPCLSSRIAYGVPVTIERLAKVERGEAVMRQFGFRVFRVRYHGELVRLEIGADEMERVLQKPILDQLAQQFRALGFRFVTLDLHGFRSGAMNETITKDKG